MTRIIIRLIFHKGKEKEGEDPGDRMNPPMVVLIYINTILGPMGWS